MNKATRILANMLPDDKLSVTAALGAIPEDADPDRQAQYINDLLNHAETEDIPMHGVMAKCGGNCLAQEIIDLAKDLYEKSGDIHTFLAGMNDLGIGGKNLHVKNGKVIATYKGCYCDVPYKVKGLNPTYCQCSAGWFQRLFSEVLGKPVSVKTVDTITNGAKECTFEIDYL